VTSGKERIDLYYFGPAHTNGDAVVVFPSQRVASTGDLFSGKNPPRIDPGNGGTGVGYSPTALKMLAGLTNIESFVTGHGAVMTQQDAQEWGRFQQDFAGTIQAAFKKGLSVDDAAASVVAALSGKYSAYGLEGAFKARVTEDVGIFYKEMQR
jgi:glyoxylase-like metal-dependent hydrolase (beta-lactamase superfamily II)